MHLHGTFVHPGAVAEGKGRWIAGAAGGLVVAALAAAAVVSFTGDNESVSQPAGVSFDASWAAAQKASGPVADPSSAGTYRFTRPEVRSIYVVRSEDEAASLRSSLSEADAIRAQLGESPMLDEVAVLATDEEFATLVAEEQAMAQVISAQFVPQRVVVDLRK